MLEEYINKANDLDEVNKAYSLDIDTTRCYNAFLMSIDYNYPHLPMRQKMETAYQQLKDTIDGKMYIMYGHYGKEKK